MIPVCEPLLGPETLDLVQDCIRSGWVSSSGSYIDQFERDWAAYCGARHGVAVTSGTTALQLAVRCLSLPQGSEVILPSFTIISCVLAVIDVGCTPVLVDCDPETFCMDVGQIEKKITDKTRAIMPVHMFGHPVDMGPLLDLAERHGLFVVEDAAESHGAEYDGRKVGGIGHLGCFSFYANKIITTGEGGMVLTSDDILAERLRSLRNLAFRSDRRFLHTEIGFNYRMTNIQAAIGVAQTRNIEKHVAIKRANAAAYTARLSGDLPLRLPVERNWASNVYWMYSIVLPEDAPFDAVEFAQRLRERGVETRPLFLGMHAQPVLQEKGLFRGESYPVTDRLAKYGLYLPSGLTLTEGQIDQVCEAVRDVLR